MTNSSSPNLNDATTLLFNNLILLDDHVIKMKKKFVIETPNPIIPLPSDAEEFSINYCKVSGFLSSTNQHSIWIYRVKTEYILQIWFLDTS